MLASDFFHFNPDNEKRDWLAIVFLPRHQALAG